MKAFLRALRVFITSPAARAVLAERGRQVHVEGFDADDDDLRLRLELTEAASCYVTHVLDHGDDWPGSIEYRDVAAGVPDLWPMGHDWWKPKGPRRDLERAAALLLAELDSMYRCEGDPDLGIPQPRSVGR
jgi:hypothetical protein